jgi:hypothetical protein
MSRIDEVPKARVELANACDQRCASVPEPSRSSDWRTWARVVPDGLEPSLPGCRPGVVAAGPRDCRGGSRGTRTHKRREAATCFQDRLLIRPDDFRLKFLSFSLPPCARLPPWQPCSVASSGGWSRTNGLLGQSQASRTDSDGPGIKVCVFTGVLPPSPLLPRSSLGGLRLLYRQQLPRINHVRAARGEGIEPSSPGSRPGSLPLADPRIVESALRELNRAPTEGWSRQLGRLAPLPLGQGHTRAAAAGIEPAKGRLTGVCLYQHRPHRNTSQGGPNRTDDLRLPTPAECQAFPHSVLS